MGAALSVGTNRNTRIALGTTDSIGMLRDTERRDGDSDMMDEIPARVTRLFGNDKARPRVVRIYNATSGWAAATGSPTFTWATVDELLGQRITSVEVNWHFRTRQFSILDLKRPGAGSSVESMEPSVGQGRRSRGSDK
jgi:hypothetical protein